MSNENQKENSALTKEKSTNESNSTGCRACGCTAYVQRSGGGIVCGNADCLHGKGDHGPIT